MKKSVVFSFLLFAMVAMQNACTKDHLVGLESYVYPVNYVNVAADFCTSPPTPSKQKLKYLFILDHSQSNQPGFPNPLTPSDVSNTDSTGGRRYGPMVDFLNNLVADPNNITSFALVDFNDDASEIGSISGFDSDVAHFTQTVTTDWIGAGTQAIPAPVDKGFTNYQSALSLAKQMILEDAQFEAAQPDSVKSVYQVIFVSDGVPNIVANGVVYLQTFNADLQPVIDGIMALKSDVTVGPYIAGITLNTAFYSGPTSVPAAVTLLQQMANEGNGKFIQFASGQNVLYQQFAPPSRIIHNQLIDVFVSNENAVWWDDGRLLQDSDGDGLPDEIEDKIGSNKFLADSDGNGVNDLVEYRTKGVACKDPKCLPANRDSYAICDGLTPTMNGAMVVSFPFSTNDGLNDCEKFVLGASRATYNTNGDLIPDALALRSGLPFIAGTANATNADPFGDGLSNYQKLKVGLPVQISNRNLNMTFNQRVTSLAHTSSSDPDVDCYHFEVHNVATTAPNNMIKVMLIQNGTEIEDKPFLMQAERNLGGHDAVVFSAGDFK